MSQQAFAHGDGESTISPESLEQRQGELKLLDLRSTADYEQEHIDAAVVLPLKEISEARLTELGFRLDDEIVVYAESDIPAKKAKVLLEAIGFTLVKYLQGGLVHWKEDGYATVSGKMPAVTGQADSPSISALRIEPQDYDFGMIPREDGTVSTIFTVSNTGKEAVTIGHISTSCGCTSAELDTLTIAPEETAVLTVFFDPNFHKEPLGRFSRTVFLQTSEDLEVQAKIYVQIQEKD